MVSDTFTSLVAPAPLPIWATAAETYRHLWRHRWVYLGHLFIWAILLWSAEFLMQLLQGVFRWAEIDWTVAGTSLVDTLIYFTILILFLLAGGGLMFLSCGRAIVNGRRPHIGDSLRLHRMGTFWRHLGIYWLIVNLAPTVIVQGLRIALGIYQAHDDWLGNLGLLALYWAWAAAAAPAIVLAMPIAAFELHDRPIREGWRRLRGNRFRLAWLSTVTALPPFVLQTAYEYAYPLFPEFSEELGMPGLLGALIYWLLRAVLPGMFNLLVILVLSATVICAYNRLSPRFDHLARVFD